MRRLAQEIITDQESEIEIDAALAETARSLEITNKPAIRKSRASCTAEDKSRWSRNHPERWSAKALAGNAGAAAGASSRRFLIITDVNDPSLVVLRQANL